ncbi:uroporphyrinogen-III synthase [Colwellia psychrerythraea]|uniref:Uroporphyrinogen-III synthase n=1 Tax=Colwellia psychrerythraea TaxID=28229 RepID=A0A099L401_COLPS|nr:uroporphyrinogen-III synthase [Colwellia psychrerythraea]KGJ97674.1 Uroporphyrinogen III synthase HEM4 [Colwellia psychrerythraea]
MTKTAKANENMSQVAKLETSTNEQNLLMPGKPLGVLITRPKAKAQQLAVLLNQQGIANTSQALFDYQNNASAANINTALKHADLLIFVSVAAVEFTHANSPLNENPKHTYFAVGNTTKQALHVIGIIEVSAPPSQHEHSEGLLNLPQLTDVSGKRVVIFRGNGGREHIASSLKKRGAEVRYIESYQRVWRTLPINIAQQWRAQQINCIVVTSNDILLALVKCLSITTKNTDNYWQSQCLWVVVSERIEKNAKALGLTRVINTHSANSQILCDSLQALTCL